MDDEIKWLREQLKNNELLKRRYQSLSLDKNEHGIPYDFLCPISGELMLDPVTTQVGITYERANIQHWFDDGMLTDFKTKKLLLNQELIDNKSLQEKILAIPEPEKKPEVFTVDNEDSLLDQIPICLGSP